MISFWDASAIVPLLVSEAESGEMRHLFRSRPDYALWWGSKLECCSAIWRRERDGDLSVARLVEPLRLLDAIVNAAVEVQPVEQVRAAAVRALAVHPLRAADSLQLGAALCLVEPADGLVEFVCLDKRLRDAGRREGLLLLP